MTRCVPGSILVISSCIALSATQVDAQESNACPVDGCEVSIVSTAGEGREILLTLKANFVPDLSRNHVHVWWGEKYSVEQVSNNAEPVHAVKQGDWHPTDSYPTYVTTGASSTASRDGAITLCVSAADRNHDILDIQKLHCVSVEDVLTAM